MKVETYYCDWCKKDVGNNGNNLNYIEYQKPYFCRWGHMNRTAYVCDDCIEKIEKLKDNIEQGME